MSREDFLKILIKREEYSPAFIAREIVAKAKKEGQEVGELKDLAAKEPPKEFERIEKELY